MRFERIDYSYKGRTGRKNSKGRDDKQVESYNFHKAASVLAEYGFDCVRIPNDWRGADFLAYHSETGQTLEVQLKTCLVIAKKYLPYENLYMCFPLDGTGNWYLIKHSRLMEIVKENADHWFASKRWREGGEFFHYTGLNRYTGTRVRDALEAFAYTSRHQHLGFRDATKLHREKA